MDADVDILYLLFLEKVGIQISNDQCSDFMKM
jgi:hypothetical protein